MGIDFDTHGICDRGYMKRSGSRAHIASLARWAFPPLLTAAMLFLSFPPFDWTLCAWVALVPLFLQLYRTTPFAAFFSGCLAGTLFYMVFMEWTASLSDISPITFVIGGIFLGSFIGLSNLLGSRVIAVLPKLAPLALPAIWVTVEYLRSHIGFLSQPFGILGYSQYSLLPVAGIAAYTGVLGVSFLVVACNAVIATLVHRYVYSTAKSFASNQRRPKPLLPLLATVSLFCGWFGFHAFASEMAPPAQTLSVAIVQGNAQSRKDLGPQYYLDEVLPIYEQLTRTVGSAALVVWPSSSVPSIIPADRSMTRRLSDLAKENKIFLLIGAAGFEKFNAEQRIQKRTANSAFLFTPSGSLEDRYDKIRLLPFDEYLPARNVVPWPEWLVRTGITDSAPGRRLTLFNAGGTHFGVQICFENMFPEQSRQLALMGANFLVGQTNEAYTASQAAHYQNLAYYVFRAIENRIPLLRSATTGISCIIDATGQIVASVQDTTGNMVGVPGLATAQIEIGHEASFYTNHGDLFTHLCITTTVILIALSFTRRFSGRLRSGIKNQGG